MDKVSLTYFIISISTQAVLAAYVTRVMYRARQEIPVTGKLFVMWFLIFLFLDISITWDVLRFMFWENCLQVCPLDRVGFAPLPFILLALLLFGLIYARG